jgi:mono/diheme cytochrome c family protein
MSVSRSIRYSMLALLLALLLLGVGQMSANAQSEDPLALGARLFAENCAVCHGADGQGRIGATLAKDWPSIRPDLTVESIITNGVPGTAMPAWSQPKGGPLSEAEIAALTSYILSWQTGGVPQITAGPTATNRPPITPLPEIQGDPNNGAVLFDQNCVVCHGDQGQGRVGAALAKDWSGIRPDLTVRSTIAGGVANTLMPAWSQARGGPLSEAEIDDLTSYVLTLVEAGSAQASPTVIAPAEDYGAFTGAAGVLVFVLLAAALIALVLIVQRKPAK